MTDPGDGSRRRLASERYRLDGQVVDLAADLQAIIEASAGTNADDEHDPEGATIGFERAQVASLLERARRRLADLDQAEDRLRGGTYGRCERCGDPIADQRLAAQPAATTCVGCASTTTARPPIRRD